MRAKLSIILLVALVISIACFFTMGYAMWQIEEKGEASFSPQSYDVTNIDGVTISNTKQLNPSVFSYIESGAESEYGTLEYTINTTNFETLYCTLEIKDDSIPEYSLEHFRIGGVLSDSVPNYNNGKISFVLSNLTKNQDFTIQFIFNNKLIYHPLFNTDGYNLDGSNNIVFVLTIYDGE